MRTLKVLSLTLLMSVAFAGMTFAQKKAQNQAQNQPTKEQVAAEKIENMKKTLKLTPEQVAQLQKLYKKQANDKRSEKAQKGIYEEQLKSILTPEQYKKYQGLYKEERKNTANKNDVDKKKSDSKSKPEKTKK